ncbi:hypothetical protein CFBP4996_26380 (plasmid) [Agrobacterium leguminum]|uniref:hypothetical protein n=1 Tax=Agrobacterium leguminum TaxID=2792015 RepID=UPI0010C9C3BA|nr:hypothetical protein [Agrobacterium leguminum]WFS69522.1 hypothetical protein CFBP4996_26380 [Agrobacterium leguminum]
MQVHPDYAEHSDHRSQRAEILGKTTNQNQLFPIKVMGNRLFKIEDDFLYACITYGDGLQQKAFPGFTWTKGVGYAFLTFFVQKAFGVHRFPFFPDRVFEDQPSPGNQKIIIEAARILTPARINAISDELVSVYQHTQNLLKDKGLNEVHLKRMINVIQDRPTAQDSYGQTVMRLKNAARATGQATVQFEMDILNSWGDDGGYPHFPIMLRQTIPAAEVLYFSNMIATRDPSAYMHRDAVEPGEWVVINRSPTGLVNVSPDDIHFDEEIYQEVPGWTKPAYERFLKTHSPFPFRRAARIGERYAHRTAGWRLTPKGRLLQALLRIFS